MFWINEVQTGGCEEYDTEDKCTSEDGRQEFVELYNPELTEININGWRLEYLSAAHNGTDDPTRVLSELKGKVTAGGFILMSFADYIENADFYFGQTSSASSGLLAKTGGHVRLVDQTGKVVDQVGWGSAKAIGNWPITSEIKPGLSIERFSLNDPTNILGIVFKTPTRPTTPETGGLILDDELPGNDNPPADDEAELPAPKASSCKGVVLSELLVNPEGSDSGKEFIEIYNPTTKAIKLDGCQLQTSANGKIYKFENGALQPMQYKAVYNDASGLTLANSSGGSVYLIDSDDSELAQTDYPAGMEDDAAWALSGVKFVRTFTPTPNAANKILASKPLEPCPAGQFRNGETNRCNNIVSAASGLTPCNADQERNAETNRCRKISSSSGSSLKPCAPNQSRNPETNRCRNIASLASVLKPCAADQFRNPDTNRCKKSKTSDLKPCKENQERNPETNRCRNVAGVLGAIDGNNPKDVQAPAASARGWLLAIGGVVGALLYAVWEWRNEALLAAINLRQKFFGFS